MLMSYSESYIQYCTLKTNMTDSSTQDKLITPKELAFTFGLSPASIYRLVEGRKIKFYKIGWVLRFKKSDIEEYLSDVQVEPAEL